MSAAESKNERTSGGSAKSGSTSGRAASSGAGQRSTASGQKGATQSGGRTGTTSSGRPATSNGRSGSGRPPSRPGGGSGSGKGRPPRPPAGRQVGPKPSRFSAGTIAFAAVAVIVVVVLIVVLVSVTGHKNNSATGASAGTPAVTPVQPVVLHAVSTVPPSVWNAVGTPSSVPTQVFTVKKGQPPLIVDGKPGSIFVGGLFCPLCGADRWAMVEAFSRFGVFTGLQQTTSSPVDSDPSTATFDFSKATLSSPYVAFSPVERFGNDSATAQVRAIAAPLTAQQAASYAKYGTVNSVPYFNVGNKLFSQTAMYDPAILAGLTWSEVAAKLKNPSDPVTQAIVGAANYITAGICHSNGQKPASVCTAPGVQKAATAVGLS